MKSRSPFSGHQSKSGLAEILRTHERALVSLCFLVSVVLLLLPTTGFLSEIITSLLLVTTFRWLQLIFRGRRSLRGQSVAQPGRQSLWHRPIPPIVWFTLFVCVGRWSCGPNDSTLITYQYSTELPVPLVIHWSSETDVLVLPNGWLYLPPGTIHYSYAANERVISGVIKSEGPAGREQYMRIGDDGIAVHE